MLTTLGGSLLPNPSASHTMASTIISMTGVTTELQVRNGGWRAIQSQSQAAEPSAHALLMKRCAGATGHCGLPFGRVVCHHSTRAKMRNTSAEATLRLIYWSFKACHPRRMCLLKSAVSMLRAAVKSCSCSQLYPVLRLPTVSKSCVRCTRACGQWDGWASSGHGTEHVIVKLFIREQCVADMHIW